MVALLGVCAGDVVGAGRGVAAGVWPIGGRVCVVVRAGAGAGAWVDVGRVVADAGGAADGGALFRSRVRSDAGRCAGGVVACPEITRAAARAIMDMIGQSRGEAPTASVTYALGNRIQKVAPSPGAEITPIDPPCNSTSRLARARPTPCPSTVERSRPRRLKGSNN